ncbi:unnamed protein product [Rangifer tarandus platyrhynchus]|uniref:Uncharacterized protein n=1 Tax=Rangifer tarandus platyrhynchus TaxID=3082113 RepID=A0ABN8ZIP2_RANTA|nr:unnamed protein product [Rangifer tarandus platyrhynchus]
MAFSCGSLGSHRASSPLSPAGQDCTRLDLALEEGPQALPLGQERGEGRPWVGSPTAGVLAEREGESLRRRLALCLDDFLRTRQAPLWSLPFPASTALCTRRAPRPLPSTSRAARCPLPVAAPARDLRPVLSDCSLSPRSINTSFSRREGRGPVRLLTETGKRRAVGHCHTQAQGDKPAWWGGMGTAPETDSQTLALPASLAAQAQTERRRKEGRFQGPPEWALV